MACYSFQRTLYCSANNLLVTRRTSNKLISFTKPRKSYSSNVLFKKGFGRVSCSLSSDWCKVAWKVSLLSISTSAEIATLAQDAIFDSADHRHGLLNPIYSNGRVMLIDGTSIIYRAYYKLLAKLHHGHLSDADGNGDRVLTIFTALSLAMLRSDLPLYMVPFSSEDLTFMKPEDNWEKFTSLLTAISAYAEGFSPDSIIRKAYYLWKQLERQ